MEIPFKIRGSRSKAPRFKSTHYHSGDYRTNYTRHLLSVPLLDGRITNDINSIFCYIRQMAALQNSYSKQFSHFKVYDTSLSTKPARACNNRGSNLRKCTQHKSRNYRFLDIQIILNKLGVTPVVHRATPFYKSVSTSGPWEFLLYSG
ncbi:hypothetical protein AVEN_211872-1 [Araneus ventricosus]|uniref:Uncharacterized protein n=1 Tax=Araneus ventricosus TaxID=182803 RepID=A0A4Y2SH76_ARAVE|nr:hypothetical protein AVEN_211872-1 [Araneus ventricosus]